MKLNKDIISYLIELQEIADNEFGIAQIPDPYHTFDLSESEVMIIYFALKNYLGTSLMNVNGVSGKLIIDTTKLMERILPQVEQFTKNRIAAINRVRPDNQTQLEDKEDYITTEVM